MPGYDEQERGGQPVNMEALIKKVLSDEESRKEQEKKIDNIQSNLRIIGNMLCDEDGNCKVATKEDLARVSESQGTKIDLNQLSNKQLYGQLSKSKVAVQDLKDLHLQKLKEDQNYLKAALEDKALVGKMATLLCDDSGCRLVFNTAVDEARKAGKAKGEKEFFLTKEK